MDMDDDDEFGDLYTDVLRPLSTTLPRPPSSTPLALSSIPTPSTAAAIAVPPRIDKGGERAAIPAPSGPPASNPPLAAQTLASRADREEDWILGPAPIPEEQTLDWNEDDDDGLDKIPSPRALGLLEGEKPKPKPKARVLVVGETVAAAASEAAAEGLDGGRIRVSVEERDQLPDGGYPEKMEIVGGIGDLDGDQVIPGISVGPVAAPAPFHGANGGDSKGSKSDEWESDSEDDLQIVLNDDSVRHLGERHEGIGSDDEDGEDDLVIVADDGQHHHHPAMEEQDWGEESLQPALDGEKKDIPDAAKASMGIGAVSGPRAGYGHTFHPLHPSQFKYVRPGATAIPGGAAAGPGGAPGQVRPPLTMGLMAGRGRGAPKGFHSGYGLPVLGNNATARPFGGGLEFTLPSHKTVFDINIDIFEEKPWRYPGVDVTDFFNFGLDEDKWKDYCKQLEQLRLEATMQSKIRVYESGRSEQDYDPDLPPELAAATGLQDVSVENAHPGKMDSGQSDLFNQGTTQRRPQLPTGRAIQVEGGFGERLPSMDTRPPRMRDSDAIIEIVLQDFEGESNKSSEQQAREASADGPKESCIGEEDDMHGDSKHNGFSQNDRRNINSIKVPAMGSIANDVLGGDGILPLPPKLPAYDHCRSKVRSPSRPDDLLEAPEDGRQTSGMLLTEDSNDGIHSQNVGQKAKSNDESLENHKDSPAFSGYTARDLSLDAKDDEHDDRLALADSTEGEGEDLASDLHISSSTHDDNSSPHSIKKQKLSSRVEQPAVLQNGDTDDLRKTLSDNSRAKSVSSKDYAKQGEGGEDEVMQDARSRRSVDLRRHYSEEDRNSRRRDDYGHGSRHDINRSHIPLKAREDSRYSRPYRDVDLNSAQHARKIESLERTKDRDGSAGGWHKRDDDIHNLRAKDKDIKREHRVDIGSRHKNKIRVCDRKGRDDDLHLRKGSNDGDWRTRHGREAAPRKREREDILAKQRENFDDVHTKRRKDEENNKRENVSKEILHGYRSREDVSQSKRGRNDNSDHRSKEDLVRARDKVEGHHSARHKDENWRHKEREDRQRLKQGQENTHPHREREEERVGVKSTRVLEAKSHGGNVKPKDAPRGSENDSLLNERRRHDQSRRRDRIEEVTHSQHKGSEETRMGETLAIREEKSSRHGRVSSHSGHTSNTSDGQNIYRERNRDSRKIKDTEVDQNGVVLGTRKHEDQAIHRGEKTRCSSPSNASMKGSGGQENNSISSAALYKKGHLQIDEKAQATQEQYKEEIASDDENLQESRRGRSKLERWTSHKERDFIPNSIQSFSSRVKEVNANNVDMAPPDESTRAEVNNGGDLDNKESASIQMSDKEERDRHLETVEKLKKRSERFNLPMPGEKETVASKRVENEASLAQSENVADSEIKQERPARKRRWVSG